MKNLGTVLNVQVIDDVFNPKFSLTTDALLFAESENKALPIYRTIDNYLLELQKTQEVRGPYWKGEVGTGFRCSTQLIGKK